MAKPGKSSNEGSGPLFTNDSKRSGGDRSQLEFELEFFSGILARHPDYVEVLRVLGNLYTVSGRYQDGLQIDRKLAVLRPSDPLVHYNLACSYALLQRKDQALKTLRRAVELGYHDFRFMREDRDLEAVRSDPRFNQLLREFENR